MVEGPINAEEKDGKTNSPDPVVQSGRNGHDWIRGGIDIPECPETGGDHHWTDNRTIIRSFDRIRLI